MSTLSAKQLAQLMHIPKGKEKTKERAEEQTGSSSGYAAQLFATQVHRLTQLGKAEGRQEYVPEQADIFGLLDSDLQAEIGNEMLPENRTADEKEFLGEEIKTADSGSFEVFQAERKRYKKMRVLLKAYEQRVYEGISLSEDSRNHIGRQLIIELKHFQKIFKNLIEAAHNSVAASSRSYSESDRAILDLYHDVLGEIERSIANLFADNYEIAIQARKDELRHTAQKLKGKLGREGEFGSKYITPASREKVIYGDESPGNYILAALRNGNNVELLGPTGTGKTRLAMEVCEQFSGKKPYILSGGPGVSRRDFYGSPSGLNTRNPGAIETCIREDKVLIIDEDNRIDPRQIAEIKLLLGLKSGDTFTHPDTGEVFTIPAHFRVMVTRNEKGKHHTDRYDLPPDYRREFTHGSFEIGYYTPAEMYDFFLLPKLIDDDGSISLSREEVGGENNGINHYSPLLSLVNAAEKIQKAYQENKLRNAVFESGYLIDFFDQWKEIRFKRKEKGARISFLEYMEEKLLEFLKRPIGNPDRVEILETLLSYGFFAHTDYERFRTENEGVMMVQDKFEKAQQRAKGLFLAPSGATLSADEVALLDPFEMRKIVIPEHPEEEKIQEFATLMRDLCSQNDLAPLTLTGKNIDKKETRMAVVEKLVEAAEGIGISNTSILQKTMEAEIGKRTGEFIEGITELTSRISLYKTPSDNGSPRDSRGRRIGRDPIILGGAPKEHEVWGDLKVHDEYYGKRGGLIYTKYTALKSLQESGIDIDIIGMPRSFNHVNVDGIKAIFEKEPHLKASLQIRIAEEYIEINKVKIRKYDDRVVYTHEEARGFMTEILSISHLQRFSPEEEIQRGVCEYILGMSTNDDYIVYNDIENKTTALKVGKEWKNRDHGYQVRRIYK